MKKVYLFIVVFFIFSCKEKIQKVYLAKNTEEINICCDTNDFDVFSVFSKDKIVRFQKEIDNFKLRDVSTPPKDSCYLFVGSSTFRSWYNLEEEFSEFNAINRGFGGSTFPEMIYYMDDLIFAYKPKAIIIYQGDNDQYIMKPKKIYQAACYFLKQIRIKMPSVLIYIISVKASPSRKEKIRYTLKTNEYLKKLASENYRTYYINTYDTMFDGNNFRYNLYKNDYLHLSPEGYDLWYSIIREELLKNKK